MAKAIKSVGRTLGKVAGGAIGSAFGPVGTAIGSSIGGSLLGGASSKLTGGNISPQQIVPATFSAGGINVGQQGNQVFATSTPERQSLISQLTGAYNRLAQTANEFTPRYSSIYQGGISRTQDLLGKVTPGVGELSTSRMAELESRKQASESDLRSSLRNRRVLGSSFASDAFSRSNLAFAQEADLIKAESFLQELDLTNQLEQQLLTQQLGEVDTAYNNAMAALEAEIKAGGIQLEEYNNLANIARGQAASVNDISRFNAQLRQDAAVRNAATQSEMSGFFTNQLMNLSNSRRGQTYNPNTGSGASRISYFPTSGKSVIWNS